MAHLRGYDEWKTRAPDPGSVRGDGGETGHGRTRMVWWRAYRIAKRQGYGAEWLDAQRQIPVFAGFVREVDLLNERNDR